jgi:hypothetical protein
MNKKNEKGKQPDDLRQEYDFSRLNDGVRGKYANQYKTSTNLVLLSPDVAKHFPDDRSVNAALRKVIRGSGKGRSSGRAKARNQE